MPYLPPDANRRVTSDVVDQWQVRHRVESAVQVLRDWNFEDSPERPQAKAENPADHPFGDLEVFDYPGGYSNVDAGNPIGKRRLEELQAGRSRALGRTNARGLRVGSLLTLEEHPVGAQNGEYLILSATGSVRGHALESGTDGAHEVFACTFEAYDTSLTSPARRRSHWREQPLPPSTSRRPARPFRGRRSTWRPPRPRR